MDTVIIRSACYTYPGSLLETTQRIAATLEAKGWKNVRVSTGATDGVLPKTMPVKVMIATSMEAAAKADVMKACISLTSFFTSWGDFTSELTKDVIVKSAVDAKDAAVAAGAVVSKAAGGVGIGIGMLIGAAALVAAAYLAVRFVPRG